MKSWRAGSEINSAFLIHRDSRREFTSTNNAEKARSLRNTPRTSVCILYLHAQIGDDAKTLCQQLLQVNSLFSPNVNTMYYILSNIELTRCGGNSMPLNVNIDLNDFVEEWALFAEHFRSSGHDVCSNSSRKQGGISSKYRSWNYKLIVYFESKWLVVLTYANNIALSLRKEKTTWKNVKPTSGTSRAIFETRSIIDLSKRQRDLGLSKNYAFVGRGKM